MENKRTLFSGEHSVAGRRVMAELKFDPEESRRLFGRRKEVFEAAKQRTSELLKSSPKLPIKITVGP